MDHFEYHNGELFAEQVALADIAASVGTPCYVYSRATLERHWHAFDKAFGDYPHLVCFAVKSNGNLAVLNLLARLGSGFDIVSGGELQRVLAAGGDPAKTVFSGVCKQSWEMAEALEVGVRCFNIESEGELEQLSAVAARLGKVAPISVRINPDVDPRTHPYISTGLQNNKFGLPAERAIAVYRAATNDPNIRISGVACHIGSQLTDLGPYNDALNRLLDVVEELADQGVTIDHLDFGGGLGVRYRDETPPSPAEYWDNLHQQLKKRQVNLPITIEPGRAIVANAGVLLTEVSFLKRSESTRFCIVDAGMNDLIRPALYQAYQEIVPVVEHSDIDPEVYNVVGPICESGDFLGKDRSLRVTPGDLLAVRSAGAYSAVMASNYNARPRPAEVMVDGDQFHIVRQRESIQQLFEGEQILPEQ